MLSPLDGLEFALPLAVAAAATANFCWREEEKTSLLRSLARESRESEVRSLVDPPPSDTTFSWPDVSMSDVSLERGAVEKSESNLFPDHGALGLRRMDEDELCSGWSEVLSVSLVESRWRFSSELNFETLVPFFGTLLQPLLLAV